MPPNKLLRFMSYIRKLRVILKTAMYPDVKEAEGDGRMEGLEHETSAQREAEVTLARREAEVNRISMD